MIWLFNPFLPKEAGNEVKKTIDSGFINRGKKAKEFEALLRTKFSWPLVHTVNSCTSALRLSLRTAGIKRGDEVISTPWTMIATNTAILECQGKPVFVDIDYENLNIDPDRIAEKITRRTKAIMVVHYAGYPCEMSKIYKIARNWNVPVIQDCAHALGSRYSGKWIGSFGEYNCFSFQAIKMITTGDGGAVSTSSKWIYDKVVALSWFGIDKSKRVKTLVGAFPKDIKELGYKNNCTDIDATLGLVGLKHIDQTLFDRKYIARRYDEELEDCRNLDLPYYKGRHSHSYWLYPIHVAKRRSFATGMKKAGIQVDKHNDRNDRYTIFGKVRKDLPNTAKTDKDLIHIPIHSALTESEIEYVIKTIKAWDRRK